MQSRGAVCVRGTFHSVRYLTTTSAALDLPSRHKARPSFSSDSHREDEARPSTNASVAAVHRGRFATASAQLFHTTEATGGAPDRSVASRLRRSHPSPGRHADSEAPAIGERVHAFMAAAPRPSSASSPTAAAATTTTATTAEEEAQFAESVMAESSPPPPPSPRTSDGIAAQTPEHKGGAEHVRAVPSDRAPTTRRQPSSRRVARATSTTAAATTSLLRVLKKDSTRPRAASPSTSSSTPPPSPPKPVSAAFLQQLQLSMQQKALDWESMSAQHAELPAMPLYSEHEDWTTRYGAIHAATPLHDADEAVAATATERPPVFVCTAPTGAGKSVLVSFCFLDAHWRAVAAKVAAAARPETSEAGEARSLPLDDLAVFARRLQSCSRVCIVVSQPTRLACVELAKYTSALLSSADHHSAVGDRVGYAVGGETCFSANTEIVYATAGYILNALQHRPHTATTAVAAPASTRARVQAPLRPTTLIIDEAHCRDVETDLLLAWVRLQRAPDGVPSSSPLRQVVVMSATLNAAAMHDYFCGSGKPEEAEETASSASASRLSRPCAEPIWLLTAAQQQQIAAAASSSSSSSSTASVRGQINKAQTPLHVDKHALSLLARTSPATGPYTVERYFLEDLAPPPTHARGEASAGSSPRRHGAAGRPRRQDTSRHREAGRAGGGLQQSALLFPWAQTQTDETREASPLTASSFASQTPQGRSGPRRGGSLSVPPRRHTMEKAQLRTPDGLALLHELQNTFSSRFFGTGHASASVQLYGPQAARIAELVLQLFQALRLGREHAESATTDTTTAASRTPNAPVEAYAPETILLFLPGFAEIQLVLQSLERRCTRSLRAAAPFRDDGDGDGDIVSNSADALSALMEPILVLAHGKESFSVPVLHAAAVGSPHVWLRATGDTRTAPHQRLVLATGIAESSLTIPGVRVVLDACLERRFLADPVTGTTRKHTSVVSAGSLLQRCGRAGRTGPGVVIHLAPRALFDTPDDAAAVLGAHRRRESSHEINSTSSAAFDALAESPATILLRVKSLFTAATTTTTTTTRTTRTASSGRHPPVSTVLAAMPHPPSSMELEAAYQQLVDMDLLLPPAPYAEMGAEATRVLSTSSSSSALCDRLDRSVLSPKGRLVALLPVPMESALLIYHAFAFGCVEEAVLLACAMTMPSLFTTPRLVTEAAAVRPHDTPSFVVRSASGVDGVAPRNRVKDDENGDDNRDDRHHDGAAVEDGLILSPLEQYSRHLRVQRQLAGTAAEGKEEADDEDDASAEGDVRRGDQGRASSDTAELPTSSMERLSEPLVLRALMRDWYACPSSVHLMVLQNTYHLNRSAMRSVDVAIAQCCQRLLQCLAKTDEEFSESAGGPGRAATGSLVGVETEEDAHDYFVVSASSAPSSSSSSSSISSTSTSSSAAGGSGQQALPFLIDAHWPPRYRERLSHSLYRLRHAARARASHRLSSAHSPREALPQWCGADRELALLVEGAFDGGHVPGVPVHPSLVPTVPAVPSSVTGRSLATGFPSSSEAAAEGPTVFEFGSAEARLRAAYVAAFARLTLQGTDGGYRRHHRRLVRNMDALRSPTEADVHADDDDGGGGEGRARQARLAADDEPEVDALGVASFAVDVRAVPAFSASTTTNTTTTMMTSLRPLMTPARLLSALQGLLGKSRVAQAELFRDGRTAVVRFARGRSGRAATTRASAPASATRLQAGRLSARVYHRWQGGTLRPAGSPAETSTRPVPVPAPPVRLAPFGFSLLVATQSVLQRLPIELPVTVESAASAGFSGASTPTPMPAADGRVSRPAVAVSSPLHFVAGVEEDGTDSGARVHWHNNTYGTPRVLWRTDVAALGLAEWFPTPASPPPSRGVAEEDTASHASAARVRALTDEAARATTPAPPTTASTHEVLHNDDDMHAATWSVLSPVNITRGIYWKVGLPSTTAWLQWRAQQQQDSAEATRTAEETAFSATTTTNMDTDTTTTTTTLSASSESARYCPVCHVLCVGEVQRAAHCRGVLHLQHLHFAVQHGLAAHHVERVLAMEKTTAASTPLHTTLFLPASSSSSSSSPTSTTNTSEAVGAAMLPLEFYPCRLSPLSFLNALQWYATHQTAPLAVAGALISSASSSSSSSSSSSTTERAASTVLTAHHVWLLPPVVSEGQTRRQGGSAGAAPAAVSDVLTTGGLLTLAGFLTASTRRTPAMFLFDEAHTHVHAVQLRGRGMWSFHTQPLPVRELGALAYMMRGGAWPGVRRRQKQRQTTIGTSAESSEGLHWCVPDPSAPCPRCTFYQPETAEEDSVVAVLLLVLHEYLRAQRRMVTLADYVERVVAKLDAYASPSSTSTSSSGRPRGSAMLAAFFQRRQEERQHGAEEAEKAIHVHPASPRAVFAAPHRHADPPLPTVRTALAGDSLVVVLRAIGCQFVVPPQALADPSRDQAATRQALSPLALAVQGASLDMQFTVPGVLPTYLPTTELEARTRQFYEGRRGAASGVTHRHGAHSDGARRASSLSSPPPVPPF